MRSFAADDLFGRRDPGAVDEAVQMAKGLEREIDRGLRVTFACNIGECESGDSAKLGSEFFARRAIEVGDHDRTALGNEKPRRGRAQPRCAAGNEKNVIADLHGKLAFVLYQGRVYRAVMKCPGLSLWISANADRPLKNAAYHFA